MGRNKVNEPKEDGKRRVQRKKVLLDGKEPQDGGKMDREECEGMKVWRQDKSSLNGD